MPFFSTIFPPFAGSGDDVGSQSSLQISTHMGSSNGNRGRLDGRQMQGLADRSHEGEGQHRLYGTDQFTCYPQSCAPRRWASPPRATLSSIATVHKHEVEAEELVGL